MKRLVPLSVVASALACFVLAGRAQAAPATGGVLGKLAAESHTVSQIEKAGWRRRSCYRRSWGGGWRYQFAPLRYKVLCSRPADRYRATSEARLFLVGFILWPRPARRP